MKRDNRRPSPDRKKLSASPLRGADPDAPDDKDVELSSDDSFPASDPPSWTPVSRTGRPKPAAAPVGRILNR